MSALGILRALRASPRLLEEIALMSLRARGAAPEGAALGQRIARGGGDAAQLGETMAPFGMRPRQLRQPTPGAGGYDWDIPEAPPAIGANRPPGGWGGADEAMARYESGGPDITPPAGGWRGMPNAAPDRVTGHVAFDAPYMGADNFGGLPALPAAPLPRMGLGLPDAMRTQAPRGLGLVNMSRMPENDRALAALALGAPAAGFAAGLPFGLEFLAQERELERLAAQQNQLMGEVRGFDTFEGQQAALARDAMRGPGPNAPPQAPVEISPALWARARAQVRQLAGPGARITDDDIRRQAEILARGDREPASWREEVR